MWPIIMDLIRRGRRILENKTREMNEGVVVNEMSTFMGNAIKKGNNIKVDTGKSKGAKKSRK